MHAVFIVWNNQRMVKVLLAYEDFNELTLTETYLKKVGFDVSGITNELLIQDQILSFHPEIIVAHGKNSRVSSFSVGQKLKDSHRYLGKVVIVVPKGVRPAPEEMLKIKMDAIVEAPVDPERLIQVLCRLSGLDSEATLARFQKMKSTEPELAEKMMMVTGSGALIDRSVLRAAKSETPNVPLKDPARAAKYDQIVAQTHINIEETSHTRAELKERQNELKKEWSFDDLEATDELRRQFAEALFKKK